jgi:hypothetical protein
MRPDDDMKLGRLLKLRGFRQDVVDGTRALRVPWYGSVRELVLGLEKNSFSGLDYRLGFVIAAQLVNLFLNIAPFVMVFVAPDPARWLFAGSVATMLFMCWGMARSLQLPWHTALGFPLASLLLIYIQSRTVLLTYVRGGIQWRGTFYPLSELRANRL